MHKRSSLKEATSEFDDSRIKANKSTDGWPFFYMPIKKYPLSYLFMILILLTVSIIYIRKFISGANGGFSITCFFLGAGFMLVEPKWITELALVYGSTWIVISIVVASILIMAFFANVLVIRTGTSSPPITYSLIFVSLIVGLGSTFADFSSFVPWANRMIMSVILTLPLFFQDLPFLRNLKSLPL